MPWRGLCGSGHGWERPVEQHRGWGLPRLVACDVATACWVDSGLEGPVLWAQGAGAEAAVNADVVTSGLFLRATVTRPGPEWLKETQMRCPPVLDIRCPQGVIPGCSQGVGQAAFSWRLQGRHQQCRGVTSFSLPLIRTLGSHGLARKIPLVPRPILPPAESPLPCKGSHSRVLGVRVWTFGGHYSV